MAARSTSLTPKLRFPEFRDGPEWEVKEVGDVFDVTRGEVLAMPLVRGQRSSETPYPVYSSQTKSNGLAGFYSEFLYENAITWTTDGANAGQVNYRGGKFYCTNVCGVLLSDSGYANPCVAAMLDSVTRSYVSYVGNPKLMNGVMARISIPFPSLAEQQKIADCLTSLDQLIDAEGRKLEALRVHKQGLMQQLFPREGEKIPRLRFPEFRDAPEWEERPLKALAEYENGKAYEQDIVEEGRFVVVNSRFVSTDGAVRKYTNAEYCTASRGDVLMVLSDLPNGKALAKCFLVDSDEQYAVNQRVSRLRPTDIESTFFYYRLNRSPRLLIFNDGLNQTHLSKGNVENCLLCVPHEPAEQQQIAACLSSLDALIAAQSRKLNGLRAHKKGLMQQLFPSPEGV